MVEKEENRTDHEQVASLIGGKQKMFFSTLTSSKMPTSSSVMHEKAKKNQKLDLKGKDSTLGFLFSGAVAGTVARTTAAPFERLKILFQVQDLAHSGQEKYQSIPQSLIRMYKEEGVMGYFKGNGTNVVRAIPYQATQFVSYEKYKIWLAGMTEDNTLTIPARLTAGALAGMTSVFVSYPFDLVRCRLSAQQVEKKVYNGIYDAFKVIYKTEGITGMYRGLTATLLGIAPYVALNFTLFENLKAATLREVYSEKEDLSIAVKLALGALSGTASQTITYPIDCVRRRMQMQGYGGKPVKYNSVPEAFRGIYQKHGVKGFYRGLISNYLKVVPVVSVNFVVYEYMKRFLGLARSGKEV